MIVNYLALAVALLLSVVAAYYSIVGLAVIFSAAMIPVIVMSSTLEAGKVVAASWLYRNWGSAPRFIKYYLVVAVLVLMFITSMGIFGFLSKAHLDQTLTTGDTSIELRLIDQQIQSEQRRLDNAQKSLNALDKMVDQAEGEASVRIRNNQARERKVLSSDITAASTAIRDLNTKALPLRKENLKIEAEVGPIKYIADLIYGDSTENVLEKAVRAVILTLVFVFDPLAIMLLLAASSSLAQAKKNKEQTQKEEEIVVIQQQPILQAVDLPPPAPPKVDHGNCSRCGTKLILAQGVGILCPSKNCLVKVVANEPPQEAPAPQPETVAAPVAQEVVQEEEENVNDSWSERWYTRAKELITKKKNGTIKINKDQIVRMK